jgi:hypothetical protein
MITSVSVVPGEGIEVSLCQQPLANIC